MLRHIAGRVRDIKPNDTSPCWEICFNARLHGDDFPSVHETWITIEWPNGTYRSMVGIKPTNPIYLRAIAAATDGGSDRRVSDLCIEHGLHDKGHINLEVIEPCTSYRIIID